MERSRRPSDLPALFDKALAVGGGTHTREDIAAGLRDGRFQFWGDDVAAVITEIVATPRKRVLHVFIVAGNFKSAMAHLPEVEQFARDNGCAAITTTGRKGFLRRLPAYGFQPRYVAFTKELTQ